MNFKKIMLVLLIFSSAPGYSQVMNLCRPDNEGTQEFCARMKHLRATINVLDQQREMTLANYEFVSWLGLSLKENSEKLMPLVPAELGDHLVALKSLARMGDDMRLQAKAKQPEVFMMMNRTQEKCIGCHENKRSTAGSSGWNDVFNMNWSKISLDCAKPGRNPYLCKSMNGMATNYNHLATAYLAKVENYDVTDAVITEVLRVLKDLNSKAFFHFNGPFAESTEVSGAEIREMALRRNSQVFQKAYQLTKSCNQCHLENN